MSLVGSYRIAGKFSGPKIWRIVLKVEKIKIGRNLNLANSYVPTRVNFT